MSFSFRVKSDQYYFWFQEDGSFCIKADERIYFIVFHQPSRNRNIEEITNKKNDILKINQKSLKSKPCYKRNNWRNRSIIVINYHKLLFGTENSRFIYLFIKDCYKINLYNICLRMSLHNALGYDLRRNIVSNKYQPNGESNYILRVFL